VTGSAAPGGRFLTSSGITLAYDLIQSGSDRLVVLSHGIFGHRGLPELRRLAEALAPELDVLLFDCRGHGESGGRFSFGREEWRDLAELVRSVGQPYRAVAGVGFSFGGFHTCLAAARARCFDAVMLVSAPKDFGILDHNPFGPGLRESLRLMPRRSRPRTRLALALALGRRTMPIDCVGEVRVPIHFVHGDQDWLIHPRHARLLFERAWPQRELTVLEGGLHAEYLIEQMPDRILPLIRLWLHKILGLVPAAS
jgi:pimeloyl-ACP methyl ester carboxylesterase